MAGRSVDRSGVVVAHALTGGHVDDATTALDLLGNVEGDVRCLTADARFLSVHGLVLNLFRVGRHLLRSAHHRVLRTRAFAEWDAVTCAC